MGTKAQPTNRISNRRPNLLRSGVDGRVTFEPGLGDKRIPDRAAAPRTEQVLCP